jgi:hypothetical protein
VLLLGDSIEAHGTGYSDDVRAALQPKLAAVASPRMYPQGGDFCGTSFGVVGCLSHFTGGELWDVIHFNWGLHDMCPLVPSAAAAGDAESSLGRYAPISEKMYLENMERLYQQLKSALTPRGTLIWRTTTPVPVTYKSRNNSDVVRVNALAATLFGPHGKHPEVVVHDMYSEVVAHCRAEYPVQAKGYPQTAACPLQPNGVHFGFEGEDSAGKQLTANLTLAAIQPHLHSTGERGQPQHDDADEVEKTVGQ